jgi:hypothetical protein
MNKSKVLGNLPVGLRAELISEFNKLTKNFREGRWEPSEMSGGKICEIIYSILEGHIKGSFPDRAFKPANMVDDCKKLELADKAVFPRTVRIQIPRVLAALYEVRNNRGAGHVGGDVNTNEMDAAYVLATAKWLVAELIRHFHSVSTDDASAAVELITERTNPLIWNVNGKKRVLNTALNAKEQTLVLLYGLPRATDSDLIDWLEYKGMANYRTRILNPGHKQRLWEYDTNNRTVTLSDLGIVAAETILAK